MTLIANRFYIDFEGTIAEGKYGAGEVRIWDAGEFEAEDAAKNLKKGKLVFTFYGEKVKGVFTLVKMKNQEKNWLIIKANDKYADENWKIETVLERE